MKKVLALTLAFILSFTMASCGTKDKDDDDNKKSNKKENQETESSDVENEYEDFTIEGLSISKNAKAKIDYWSDHYYTILVDDNSFKISLTITDSERQFWTQDEQEELVYDYFMLNETDIDPFKVSMNDNGDFTISNESTVNSFNIYKASYDNITNYYACKYYKDKDYIFCLNEQDKGYDDETFEHIYISSDEYFEDFCSFIELVIPIS